jgi:hypothetical protein
LFFVGDVPDGLAMDALEVIADVRCGLEAPVCQSDGATGATYVSSAVSKAVTLC